MLINSLGTWSKNVWARLLLNYKVIPVSSQKMAELNKFTAEHQEEAGSDGEGDGAPAPAPSCEPSSQLVVQQVRTVDQDGNLKVVYPSKTDLSNDIDSLTVIW